MVQSVMMQPKTIMQSVRILGICVIKLSISVLGLIVHCPISIWDIFGLSLWDLQGLFEERGIDGVTFFLAGIQGWVQGNSDHGPA